GVADGLRLYGKPGHGLAADVPILIVSGAEDPLTRGEAGLRLLADAYRRRGVRDVTVKIYPEGRHELLNETNHDEVTAMLVTWMLDRAAGE
ncbi:MAG: alpha/beta hydrolase, partial [Leucobacter sp.]